MPKEDERRKELTQKEIEAEKFRTFFSTSVAQVPEAMSRREEEETPPKRGLFGGLFHREKPEPETKEPAERGLELPPTGEIVLGDDAEEPQADLELVLEPEEAAAEQPVMPEPKKQTVPATPEKAPQEPAKPEAPAPEPVKPAEPEKPAAPAKPAEPVKKEKPENKATAPAPSNKKKKQKLDQPAVPRSAMEQREDEEMKELKAMLFGKPKAPAKSAPKQTETLPASPLTGLVFAEDKAAPEPPKTPAEPEKTPEKPPVTPQPTPRMETAAEPESGKEKTTEIPAFRFFGKADDEVKAPTRETAPGPDDSMSLPLIGLDNEGNPSEEPPVEALKAAPAAEASTAEVPVDGTPAAEAEPASEEAPATPEEVGEKLRKMGAALTLRCVLGGILAAVLLHFGLVAEGLLAPLAALDPVVAPAAFYAANLLFLAAAMAVAAPVLRDGLLGLKKDGRPSSDTMPALAACAALLEAVVALLNAQSYQTSSFTILSGIAALGLFMALLGSRVQLAAVKNGYDLATKDPAGLQGAFRVKDKDLIRMLARSLDEKDPWVLLSRPVQWDDALLEQSFGERTSERRARKTSYILLGAAVLSGLAFLLFGGGLNGMAAAMTAMLCMGAPLSSTLVAGLATLRLQKSAAAAGAVIPGWAAIEELGGVDTVQVDADELFTADSVNLEDIRIFKGGRIDRAILYAASILNQSCETLRGLFRQIIEDRTDILYPVKDLETHYGLGFAAWCDNNRVLIGNRAYMEKEGVPVPETEYEEEHSQHGTLQILYLAVSGNLHAMFVLRSTGGRNAARGLEVLQKENIRLLVTCKDPSLTARHITDAYHLPEGMITLLEQDQCDVLNAAPAQPENAARCCMLHDEGFVSLIGGLRAAEQAQNAETAATTVQLVSVWFSVAIGVLLTYAGSIGTLSVAAVLMYQAAWSALSLAVCALKQH